MPNVAPLTHRAARHTRRLTSDDAVKYLRLPSTTAYPRRQGRREPRRQHRHPPSPVRCRGMPTPRRRTVTAHRNPYPRNPGWPTFPARHPPDAVRNRTVARVGRRHNQRGRP